MLRILIRAQLQSVLASLGRSSRGKRFSLGASIALIALLAVLFLFVFGVMFYSLALALPELGLSWLYFALAALMAFALGFIGSVFTAQQQLFSARDNELLLALPIPPRDILLARMAVLLLMDYAFTLVVLLPALAAWLLAAGWTVGGLIGYAVSSLLLPLLIMCFTCLFAWLLALISSRMRRKTLITTLLYVAFLAGYLYVYMNFSDLLQQLIANGEAVAGALVTVWPLYAFGEASLGSWAHVLGFAACCAVPFALVCAVLSRGFLAITTRRAAAKKLVYRERRLKTSGADMALLRKELGRYGSNSMYILNTATGSLFSLAGAAALLIYRGEALLVLSALPEGMGAALAALVLSGLAAMDFVSAPSVSLESKTLWLMKSLPVPAHRLLMAKVNLQLVVSLPPKLAAAIVCALALRLSPLEAAMTVIVPALTCLFSALLGVELNLSFPKFDYINETSVIKNSMSVTLTLFGAWLVIAALALVYALLLRDALSPVNYLCACAAALLAASAALQTHLHQTAPQRLLNL